MLKKIYLVSIITILFSASFVFAADELLTITTYYPSPSGSYNDLRTSRLTVGATYQNISSPPPDGNLFVQNRINIGTDSLNPGYPLRISRPWAIMALDGETDAGIQLLRNGQVRWHIWKDASSDDNLNIWSENPTDTPRSHRITFTHHDGGMQVGFPVTGAVFPDSAAVLDVWGSVKLTNTNNAMPCDSDGQGIIKYKGSSLTVCLCNPNPPFNCAERTLASL